MNVLPYQSAYLVIGIIEAGNHRGITARKVRIELIMNNSGILVAASWNITSLPEAKVHPSQ